MLLIGSCKCTGSLLNHKKLVLETVKDLIGLKARDVRLGHGSFITMGFGNDIEYTMTIRKKKVTETRAEWYLWIQHGYWELHLNETGADIVCNAEDDRTTIAEKIILLEGLALQEIKVLPSLSYTKFMFGDYGPLLIVHTSTVWYEDGDHDDIDWELFTPDRKVLCVQEKKAWIQDEDSP